MTASTPLRLSPASQLCRWLARFVVSAWAGFWIWFNAVAGWSELAEHGWPSLAGHAIFALILLGVTCVVWTRERMGAIALLVVAAVEFWLFRNPRWLSSQWVVAMMLLAPPVVSAFLLLVSPGQRRSE